MNGQPKFDSIDPSVQVVECGVVVPLDKMALQHGILFNHPDIPMFKLHLNVVDNEIKNYFFEHISLANPQIKTLAVRVIEEEKLKIIMPGHKVVG